MFSNVKRPHSFVRSGQDVAFNAPSNSGRLLKLMFILFSRGFCGSQVQSGAYWYQGVFLTQRSVNPASVRILIEAASASRTVSFTDCIRFWALCTSISVACKERGALHYSRFLTQQPCLQNWLEPGMDWSFPTTTWHSPYLSHQWWFTQITQKNPNWPLTDCVLYPQMASRVHTFPVFQQVPPLAFAVPSP